MRLPKITLPLTAVLTLTAAIAASQLTGFWVTDGRLLVAREVAAGKASLDDIKGWMTLAQVSQYFGVPVEYLAEKLGIDSVEGEKKELRDLEDILPGFEVDTVRELVAAYLGGNLSAGPEVEKAPATVATVVTPAEVITKVPITPQPAAATEKPAENTKPGTPPDVPVSASADVPEEPSANVSEPQSVGSTTAGETPPQLTASSTPDDIKGRMTLAEVCKAFGLGPAQLVGELKLPENVDVDIPLREFNAAYGVEVTAVRDAVSRLLGTR